MTKRLTTEREQEITKRGYDSEIFCYCGKDVPELFAEIGSLKDENQKLRERVGLLREVINISCITKTLCQVQSPCRLCKAVTQDDKMEKKDD